MKSFLEFIEALLFTIVFVFLLNIFFYVVYINYDPITNILKKPDITAPQSEAEVNVAPESTPASTPATKQVEI